MPEPARVTVSVAGGVADVRLNRPDKINALDLAMFRGLCDAAEQVGSDPSVRVVVLSGEGRGFCAGLDLASFQAMADGGAADAGAGGGGAGGGGAGGGGASGLEGRLPGRITNGFQQAAWCWAELPVPVIAAIHGVALGGGIQIAMAADIRIVSPDARLSVLEIRWGLIPDMTGTHTIRRLVALDVAKELTWTGRMVPGEEAVRIGLATRLSDNPRADALELATDLAGKSPDAIRAAKRLLNQSSEVGADRQFVDESREMAGLIGAPNQIEAVVAYFEKRAPAFADPDSR
jgi:enoyl-CoA hydratase/carnithine racemase